jgi:hypothetical protein
MSDLRKQLDAMKRDYASARYPGSLAADVLEQHHSRPILRIGVWGAMITGLAAAVVIWVTTRPLTQSPTMNPVVAVTQPADEQPIVVAAADEQEVIEVESISEMGTTPEFPSDVSFVPTAAEMSIPSTFTFPSMDMDFTQSTETSEESA